MIITGVWDAEIVPDTDVYCTFEPSLSELYTLISEGKIICAYIPELLHNDEVLQLPTYVYIAAIEYDSSQDHYDVVMSGSELLVGEFEIVNNKLAFSIGI